MDSLDIFAELSIGFAGFSGIVAALRGSQNRGWHEIDKTRLVTLVASSIIGIFAALLPDILRNLEFGEFQIWQVSSGLLATFTLAMLVWGGIRFRQTNALQNQDFSPVFSFIAFIIMIPIILVLFLSAFGLLFDPSIGIYSLGLAGNLFVSAGMFVLLIRLVLRDA